MNVLIVSPGSEIVRMLSALLEPDGCVVEACLSLADARRLPRSFRAGALMVDVDEAHGDALTLIRELRTAGHLSPAAPVVALTDCKESALRQSIEAAGAQRMLKPASLLDLIDMIRQARSALPLDSLPPAPRPDPTVFSPQKLRGPGRAEARPRRGLHMGNARALARWWARKATGVLRVEGANSAWVLIARGGLVGPDGVAAVEEALAGGDVAIDPCEVEEVGDRGALARLLWAAALEAVAAEGVIQLTPVANGLTESAVELPLTAASRRCLARLDGVTIGDLARRERAPTTDVTTDFAALRWLGMITLRDGYAPQPAIMVDAPAPKPAPVSTPPTMRSGDPPSRIERPFSVGQQPEPRARDESTVDPPTTPGGAYAVRGAAPMPSVPVGMVPVARLRREVEVLRTADAWTVIGIYRRSTPEMIEESADRMKRRYLAMDQDPNPEARELAAEILRRIQAAEIELLSGKASRTEPLFDSVMRQGMAAIAAREWARADRCFTQARQEIPDNPLAVAHLGWARFNNPEQARALREKDGADLVEIALQFDIHCAVAWNLRGEIATARGEVDEARQCFSTALRLDPTLMIARRRV